MKKKLFLSLLISNFSLAQVTSTSHLGYQSIYGTPVGKIKGDKKNYISGHSITFGKNLENKNEDWVKFLSAKNVNFSIIYYDMDQMKLDLYGREYSFGKAFGATANVDFRLAKLNKFELLLSPTVGLAYITKTVHTDPDSYYFGSHLNAVFDAGIGLQYNFADDYALTSNMSFLHFSNGGIQLPNAGVNMMTASIGLQKNISSQLEDPNHQPEKPVKKNAFDLSIGGGQRGKYKIKEAFYRVSVSPAYTYFINNTLGFKIGLDAVYYDQVFNPLIYDDSVPYWGKSYKHLRLGTSIGAEIKMNKVSFNTAFGRYVYFKSPYDQKTYWKAGLRYYFTPNFGLESIMNAHKVQADFISIGGFIRL